MVSWMIKKTNRKDDHDTVSVRSGSSSSSSSSSFMSSVKWCMVKNNLKRRSKIPKSLYPSDGNDRRFFYKFQKMLLCKNTLHLDSSTESSKTRQENNTALNLLDYEYNDNNNDDDDIKNNTNNRNYHSNTYYYYYYYKENWLRFMIMVIIITIILNFFIQNLIRLFEQLRITIVSFYKWKILSSFIIPYGNNTIGGRTIIMNIVSWINFIKSVFSLI